MSRDALQMGSETTSGSLQAGSAGALFQNKVFQSFLSHTARICAEIISRIKKWTGHAFFLFSFFKL